MTGLLGGAFDPPHIGHVALARAACEHFKLPELVVLVVDRPGHKEVELEGPTRLALARAAFPGHEVLLDPHERTIDMLRAGTWADPLFVIGADELADFPEWKEPEGVLELARLAVATRPGYVPERLAAVLTQLARPDRVELFEIDPLEVSSRDIRRRIERGEPFEELVPAAVADLIRAGGLYRREPGLH